MIKDIEKKNDDIAICDKEIAILKEHFPACFKNDGSFDIERFKEELKDKVDIIHEGYELKFLGKSYAKLLATLETTTVIKPNIEHNSLPENKDSENIYISGDNLDGLKHLLKSYSKSVKCIYIDPPYNTGGDGFVYKDNFNFTSEELQHKLSVDEEQAQRILDLTTRDSASHSAWLMFMYSRLQLAKDLLKDDGVIFISIDDNEQANLKLICDDIFGEENAIGILPTIMNLKGNNDEFGFSGTHEYTIVYSRKKDEAKFFEFNIDEEDEDSWNIDNIGYYKKGRSLLADGEGKYREERANMYFPIFYKDDEIELIDTETHKKIYNPDTNTFDDDFINEIIKKYEEDGYVPILPINKDGEKLRWTWGLDGKFKTHINDIIISKTKTSYSVYKKQRPQLGDIPTKKPKSFFYKPEYSSGNGTNQMKELFGFKVFNNPKPIELIMDFITIGSDEGAIIMDFFSGSGTTSNAVLQLNALDNKKRKIISIQLPEDLNENYKTATKEGKKVIENAINFLKADKKPTTLDYVGIERIIKGADKIKKETKAKIDYGFKHFILEEPNKDVLDKCETFDKAQLLPDSSILNDFGVETVLTTWLNYDGYGLTPKVDELDLKGYQAYRCNNHIYLIDTGFTEDALLTLFEMYENIPEFNPENIILFGYSFNWTMTEMLEKNLNPHYSC